MRVAVVLDAGAVRAYARLEGLAVGELIATVAEDGDVTGVPVLALLDAWPDLADTEREMVTELIARDGGPVETLPLHADGVDPVAAYLERLGHGRAQAVAAVQAHGATLATYEPRAYRDILDPYDVLDLGG